MNRKERQKLIREGWEGGNIFTYLFKHGFKKTIDKFQHQFTMLETPRTLINKALLGYGFSLAGTIIGAIFSLFIIQKEYWWVFLIFIGAFLIQYSGFKGTLINYNQLKELEKLQEEMQEVKNEQGESNSISEEKRKKSN